MKEFKYIIWLSLIALIYFNIAIIKQNKSLMKELKEIKMIVDNLESQLKLLTPPPEFFTLPVIQGKP